MLEARSVAIVGASIKPGSLGESMLAELRRGGFDGAIYPVNPGYDEVAGLRCYPSILEVPEPVDLAILGVANARVEQALTDAAAAGAGSAVTFSSLHEEPGDGPDLRDRLRAIAVAHGMALCGGNGMGFINQESCAGDRSSRPSICVRAGAFLSHSGPRSQRSRSTTAGSVQPAGVERPGDRHRPRPHGVRARASSSGCLRCCWRRFAIPRRSARSWRELLSSRSRCWP
jgi:acyl-CoA synthetase (NDP forming)